MNVLQDIEFIGDSMIVRYLNHAWKIESPRDSQGKARIGLSVSGQTLVKVVRKLHRLQKQNAVPTKDKAIVMLGTNDMLSKKLVPVETLCRQLWRILCVLKSAMKQVIVFTIPPILNLPKEKCETLMRYNFYIRKLEQQADNVRVVDVYRLFVDPVSSAPDRTLYETHMGHGRYKRPDGIHWNDKGIAKLQAYLKQQHIITL